MTGNLLLDLALSAGGVLLLLALSWALGAWKSTPVDEAAARDRLAFDEPDFAVSDIFVAADGRTAAAVSTNGAEAAVVFQVGDRTATRRFPVGSRPVATEGGTITVRLGEISRPNLPLVAADAAEAAAWARRLQGAETI